MRLTGSMDMDMHHGRGYAAWNGHAAWTWTCSLDMDMYSSMDIAMQPGHGHAAWTNDMEHGHAHAAWAWMCSMDRDVQHGYRHEHAA
jgi:hypothetical protein